MATSTVFVLDSFARRTQIKVTPGKLMQDVLEEACRTKKVDPAGYILKTQSNKPVDLSQPFRLSGLTAGAKLQLTQASRSPSVVNIALQLPAGEGSGGRLSDKFPSTTSLWLILRKFEDGVAGSGQKLNLTQRGVPSSGSGAGGLVYEMPGVSVENRSLEGFGELQKTLAQLGYNGGNVLVRVSFRSSGLPLEEAMREISTYFAGAESKTAGGSSASQGAYTDGTNGSILDADAEDAAAPLGGEAGSVPHDDAPPASGPTAQTVENDVLASSSETHPEPRIETTPPPSTPPSHTNGLTIYRPPSSGTPAAALHPSDPSHFEPTIDHARLHQASLGRRGQNQRLKSDKELEELEGTKQQQLASVQSVRVRVQYPDQHTIEKTMPASATAAELYDTVRTTLRAPSEVFELRYHGAKGRLQTLPDLASQRLVRDLGFRGGVKVTLVAGEGASADAKRNLSLKPELLEQAREMKVELESQREEGEAAHKEAMAKPEKQEEGKGKGRSGDVEAKMKKFLGFGRK